MYNGKTKHEKKKRKLSQKWNRAMVVDHKEKNFI
jgi:hypothetical protein